MEFAPGGAGELWIQAEFADGKRLSGPVRTGQAQFTLFHPDRLPLADLFSSYFRLGVHHIAIGWDHLLFLTGLLLGVHYLAPLLAGVTSFTLAHTVSLAATLLWGLSFPPPAVEVLIALSIVLVARQRLRDRTGQPSSPLRLSAVAFGFGLVHGLGFAAALRHLGVPGQQLAWALAAFNLGVEFGQLLFVAGLFPLLRLWQRRVHAPSAWADLPAWGLGVAGACLTLERFASWSIH